MFKKSAALLAAGVLIFQSAALARPGDWDRHGGPRWGGHHHEVVVHRLPPGYTSVLVAGLALLYAEGLFYRHTPAGYVVIQPPVGAVVPVLPPGYTTVVMNGIPYYYYGYTYYAPSPNGYVVVQPPVAAASVIAPPVITPLAAAVAPAPAPISAMPAAAPSMTAPQAAPQQVPAPSQAAQAAAPDEDDKPTSDGDNKFDIYIPNNNGSYTLVTLMKTDKGFLGPQGEFYEDHPTVEQLRKRYNKK